MFLRATIYNEQIGSLAMNKFEKNIISLTRIDDRHIVVIWKLNNKEDYELLKKLFDNCLYHNALEEL